MNEKAVVTQGLTRRFGDVTAVNDFSIRLPRGRVLALLGSNGAGKTTLHRLLAGLLEPTCGNACVLGAESRAMPPETACRVASVIEGAEPEGWARAVDIFALHAAAYPAFDPEAAREMMRARDLPLKRQYRHLSRGQRRWLLNAAVLASRADLLLLDEPADGLDTAARREVFDRLRDYVTDQDATALVATHIISDIERVADDVAIIKEGRLQMHEELEVLRETVREVGAPREADLRGMPLDVLAEKRKGDVRLLWARSEEWHAVDLPPGARTRHVSLEELYLSVAGTSQEAAQPVWDEASGTGGKEGEGD